MGRHLLAVALGTGLLVAPASTRADDPEAARRAQVVVHIGPTRTISVGEEEDRVAALPPFQRTTFGADADAIRRAFLMQILLPDALFALGADEQKLDRDPRTAFELERARSQASIRALRERLGPASSLPMSVVQGYYDANRARYDTPERYQIWRILCKTKDEAQSVLDAAKKDPTPKEFGELARDHSVDKATNLRAGNLGFISPDGSSNEPGLRVDPALVRAVQSVRDGELVPTPVAEGDYFSVVWRRGTIAANKRTVDDVAPQIRDTLWKARLKTETEKLVASLRAAKLRDLDESLLDTIDVSATADAGSLPLRKDGGVSLAPSH
jgi:peptidyl-prolyl cis-trans isomerase C